MVSLAAVEVLFFKGNTAAEIGVDEALGVVGLSSSRRLCLERSIDADASVPFPSHLPSRTRADVALFFGRKTYVCCCCCSKSNVLGGAGDRKAATLPTTSGVSCVHN